MVKKYFARGEKKGCEKGVRDSEFQRFYKIPKKLNSGFRGIPRDFSIYIGISCDYCDFKGY